VIGIFGSLMLATPIGPTIVVVDMICFGLCFLGGKLCKQ